MSFLHRRFILLVSVLSIYGYHLMAQDYLSDSVYYTPIPKRSNKSPAPKGRDTLRASYFFTIQTGSLIGCKDCNEGKEVSFTSSIIQGVSIGKKLRLGGGVGYDTYVDWQTVPIFVVASWDLFGNRNTNALYFQFGYGWAKPWMNKISQEYGFKDVRGGSMINLQLGYRINYYNLRITFVAGTKLQQVSSYYEYPSYYPSVTGRWVPGEPGTKIIEEELMRIQFMMGIGWK
jgi:hypothetical protein